MASHPHELGRRVVHVDTSAPDWRLAAHRSVAVVVCLAVGVPTGHGVEGLTAGLGALLVGLLYRRGPYVQEAQSMLVGLAFLAPMILLAGLVSQAGWVRLPVTALAALGCGLAAAWGPRLGKAAAIALAMFAIYSGAPIPVHSILVATGAFVAGGLLQFAVMVGFPLLRHPEELTTPVSDAWRALGLAAARGNLMDPAVASAVDAALAHAQALPDADPVGEDLRRMAEAAWTVRTRLIIGAPRDDAAVPETSGPVARVPLPADFVQAVARASTKIAAGIRIRRQVKPALDSVSVVLDLPEVAPGARGDRSYIDHALGDAASALAAFHRPQAAAGASVESPPIYTRQLQLGWSSPVVREAVRLSITFTVATLLGERLLDYHASWAPFTVALVTQQGYAGTMSRTLSRIAGTLVGILMTAAAVEFLPAQGWWMVLLLTVSAFAIYLLGPANYSLAVMFITVFAVSPVAFEHGPIREALLYRGLATLLGGGIVIVGALVAPRRSAPRLAGELADYADRVHEGLTATLADPSPELEVHLQAQRHAVTAKLVATLDEVWAEPRGHGLSPRIGQEVFRQLKVVSLYRADLADGVVDRDSGEPQRALAGLVELSGRLRGVTTDGRVSARTGDVPMAVTGPATAALAAAQVALDGGVPPDK